MEEVIYIQKTGLESSIYLCKTFGRGKPEWFTIMINWNICIFLELLWGVADKKESMKLYIEAPISLEVSSRSSKKCILNQI